jgi:hypothetical protein
MAPVPPERATWEESGGVFPSRFHIAQVTIKMNECLGGNINGSDVLALGYICLLFLKCIFDIF